MANFPITDVVTISHLVRTANTEEYEASPTYENVNACISPTGTDIQTSYGDVASYQLFEIFIYDITLTLQNADRIENQAGIKYIVSGVPYVINNRFLQYTRVMARQVV